MKYGFEIRKFHRPSMLSSDNKERCRLKTPTREWAKYCIASNIKFWKEPESTECNRPDPKKIEKVQN